MLSSNLRTFASSTSSFFARHTSRNAQLPRQPYRTITTFKLNTGASIPAIGFGTWQDKDAQEGAVLTALKAGYRHIDGARVYGTERAVGNAIKQSGIPRKELFITTKLWNNAHHPDDVEAQLEESLRELQLDYVDLWLMHWPSPFARSKELMPQDENKNIRKGDTDYTETWAAMEKAQKSGKTRAIGVSNFSKGELERLLESSKTVPAVHQMELHPYLQQRPFTSFHKEKGIHVTHYSPFGNANPIYTKDTNVGKLIEDPLLVSIGKKHNKSGAQVALAWGIAQGHSVIPKSKTEKRILDNLEGGFELSGEEMEELRGLDNKLRFNDPSERFRWRFYSDLEGV